MALPTIPEISFKFVGKPDNLNSVLDPDEIKAALDAGPEEVRQAAIALTNALSSITDSSSGADNIGATAISTSPATVQGILEWLKAQIDTIVAGGVADGSVTDAKLSGTVGQIKERVATHVALSSSETVKAHVELATAAETTTGTDATRAVHPAGLKVELDKKIPSTQKGVANGVATLDASVKIPLAQLGNALKAISGSYSGDGVAKTISVPFTPGFVSIISSESPSALLTVHGNKAQSHIGTNIGLTDNVSIVTGGFNIGTTASMANATGVTYYWTALP